MRRIESWLVLGTLGLSCWACADDKPLRRHAAPGEGVLAAAGKAATSDGDDDGSGAKPANPVEDEGGATAATGTAGAGSGEDDLTDTGAAGAPSAGVMVGTELRIQVGADSATFVNLESASQVDVGDAEREASPAWDLVFQGWEIFTNGGASGSGKGAAFGPLPLSYFLEGTDPTEVPFLIEDKAAGAFRDWYFYDGQWHALYSRFHAYGVKSGGRLFKLQLLGYYGDVQGAPISALYHLRYAEFTPEGDGAATEVTKLDATAGGLGGSDDATSACLALHTGAQQQLTTSQAATSSLWDLAFRRDSVSVNGGLGGPGGVTAVDLDADATEGETLDIVKLRTAENQAAAFAKVDYGALTQPALKYRGDRIVSAFSDAWADLSLEPPKLADDNTWLVVSADGTSRFLLNLAATKNSTTEAPGTVVMRIQKLR